MANRYWVGGTGTWDTTSTTNWSTTSGGAGGASVPTTSDVAIFNASSGAGTVTLGENVTCNVVTFNGTTITTVDWNNNTITVTGNATTVYNGGTTPPTMLNNPIVISNYSGSTGTRTFVGGTIVAESSAVTIKVTAGSDIVTIGSGNNTYKTIDFTGFSGTLSVGNRIIYGSVIFPATMTHGTGGSLYSMLATSGSYVVDTNNISIDEGFTFNGAATWTLSSNLNVASTRTVTLTNGTLDLNNNTLSCGLFNSANNNIRTLMFGTGNVTITGSNATIWSGPTGSNTAPLLVTGTPVVNCTYSGSTGTRTISSGNTTLTGETNSISFNISAGSDIVAITGNHCAKNVNFTGFTGTLTSTGKTFFGNVIYSNGMVLSSGSSATIFASTSGTKTIATNGKTLDFPITFDGVGGTWEFADALTQGSTRAFTITNGTVKLKASVTSTVGAFATSGSNQKYLQSATAGSQATLSQASGTVNASYLTIKDINATGGATWNAYRNLNNIDAGNNTGWDFLSTPVTTTTLAMRLGFGL